MAGYIGKSQSITQVDGYNKTEADSKFVEGDDTLYVDETNNRVGIGTDSPTQTLNVNSGGANYVAKFESSDGLALILAADNATTNTVAFGASGNNAVTYTDNTERMRIDSAGRVTMPYQPAFMVSGTTNNYTSLITANGISNTIPYSLRVSGRNDEGFNYSTGTYTAPVSGVYMFTVHYLYQSANNGEVRFYVNGVMKDRFYAYSERTGSGSAIHEMSAGDYIQVTSDFNVWLGTDGGYGSLTVQLLA